MAWDDYGQTFGPAQGNPDVLRAFYRAPAARFPEHTDCSIPEPCTSGEGDCFTAAAPTLAPGASSDRIELNFRKSDNTNFDENKDTTSDPYFDYSWRSQSTFSDWNKVGLYWNGTRVWGTPP